jgi:flavin-dependent dehydrogenase
MATYLARAGLNVVLFEREKFPRFRIGESLLPLNLPILRDLGVADEMERRFIRKYAANFSDRTGKRQARYPFARGINKSHAHAYEVDRAEFDQVLLDNAARHGAKIRMEWAVREVLWEGERAAGVRAVSCDGARTLRVECPMVVDASGRSAFVGSRLGMKRDLSFQTRTAFFAHYEGVQRESGEREGDIQVVAFPHGWFWMIPFKGNVTSVGVVVTDEYLKRRHAEIISERRASDEHDGSDAAVAGRVEAVNDTFLREAIEETDCVAVRMKNAKQRWPARTIANFSYVMDRYAGDGYVVLGDAGAFLDPVFSTGVFLTMKSAQVASQVILKCHRAQDYSARHFRGYERRIRAAQKIFFRFIRGWYDPAFVDLFFYPRNFLGLRSAITSVLAADLFDWRYLWSLKLRIGLLFLIAELHRRHLRWERDGRSLVQKLPV